MRAGRILAAIRPLKEQSRACSASRCPTARRSAQHAPPRAAGRYAEAHDPIAMTTSEPLKPCPACGKQAGELVESKGARFPFRAHCRACGWSTDAVKLAAVAVKLWNEAKCESKAKARP